MLWRFWAKEKQLVEPLRNWIKTAHHAEKLALSNDFYEIKSLAEKIGTNRRLLSRKAEFEFVRPYDLIPKYRAFCEARPAEGGASEQQIASEFEKSLIWSGRLDLNQRPLAPKASALNHAAPRPDAVNLPQDYIFCNFNKRFPRANQWSALSNQ